MGYGSSGGGGGKDSRINSTTLEYSGSLQSGCANSASIVFDGTDDVAFPPWSNDLQIGGISGSSIHGSFAFWMKNLASQNNKTIIGYDLADASATSYYSTWKIHLDYDYKLKFATQGHGKTFTTNLITIDSSVWPTGSWNHMGFTLEGHASDRTACKFYLNGTEISSADVQAVPNHGGLIYSPSDTGVNRLFLGAHTFDGSRAANVAMDDVAMWNVVLSGSDFEALSSGFILWI